MVSLVQCLAGPKFEEKGWYTVSSKAPYTVDTPIGSPSVMTNSAGEYMMIFSDGSAAYLGAVAVLPSDVPSPSYADTAVARHMKAR